MSASRPGVSCSRTFAETTISFGIVRQGSQTRCEIDTAAVNISFVDYDRRILDSHS